MERGRKRTTRSVAEVHTGVSESDTCTKGRVSLAFRDRGYGLQRWAGTDRQKSKRACEGAGAEVSERRLAYLESSNSHEGRLRFCCTQAHRREKRGKRTYSIWDLASRSPWSAAIRGRYLTVWRRAHSEKTSETVVIARVSLSSWHASRRLTARRKTHSGSNPDKRASASGYSASGSVPCRGWRSNSRERGTRRRGRTRCAPRAGTSRC